MGVSPVIILLIVVPSLQFVICESVQNRTRIAPVSEPPNVASEGGSIILPDSTHEGREHMKEVHHTQPPINATNNTNDEHMIKVNHSSSVQKLPPYEVGQKNDNKTSVPKKDAVLTDRVNSTTTTSTTTTTTTTTTEPHKPTMTLGEDEGPLTSNGKTKKSKVQGINIDSVSEKANKTDYVVPIVAVILSVPLVAIVFSVLYKRGADWWQHRHYRRMDFLIEGMYNN